MMHKKSENIRHQTEDLLKVLEISRHLAMTTDLQSLINEIEHAAKRVLNCERATVFVHDNATNELFSFVKARQEGIRIPADQGIAGASFQNRILLNINDAYKDSRFNRLIDKETQFKTRNLLACPLFVSKDQVLGVLEVLNKSERNFDTGDEILLQTFAAQAAISIHRQFLMEEYGEKKRLQSELETARHIQQGLLPKHAPTIEGYDISGWSKAAEETSGDYYDFQALENDELLLVIADVSGHGIGPALLAAQCAALHRAIFSLALQTQQNLNHINRLLCRDIPNDRFVTAFFGVLQTTTDVFRYISAGHGPVLIYRAADKSIETLAVQGLPLGILSDSDYSLWNSFKFMSGDILVGLTDGFVESENMNGDCFGLQRVLDVILDTSHLPTESLISHLYQSLLKFVGNVAPSDDLTAVVVKKR